MDLDQYVAYSKQYRAELEALLAMGDGTTPYVSSYTTMDGANDLLKIASIFPAIRAMVLARGVAAVGGAGASAGAMRRATFDDAVSALRHPPGIARAGGAAGPINGQAALDVSLQVGANSTRRVGVDYAQRQFVVFDEHAAGMFTDMCEAGIG
jgi:hypothetical protein